MVLDVIITNWMDGTADICMLEERTEGEKEKQFAEIDKHRIEEAIVRYNEIRPESGAGNGYMQCSAHISSIKTSGEAVENLKNIGLIGKVLKKQSRFNLRFGNNIKEFYESQPETSKILVVKNDRTFDSTIQLKLDEVETDEQEAENTEGKTEEHTILKESATILYMIDILNCYLIEREQPGPVRR